MPEDLLNALEKEVIATFPLNAVGLDEAPSDEVPRVDVLLIVAPTDLNRDVYRSAMRWARSRRSPVPILGYAESGNSTDAILALENGLDDFVAGKTSPREVACRIRALHRRKLRPSKSKSLRYGSLTLDEQGHCVWFKDQSIDLTKIELSILRALINQPERVVLRGELLEAGWGTDSNDVAVNERAVDSVVLRLRRKLKGSSLIHTVRGVGFRLAEH